MCIIPESRAVERTLRCNGSWVVVSVMRGGSARIAAVRPFRAVYRIKLFCLNLRKNPIPLWPNTQYSSKTLISAEN